MSAALILFILLLAAVVTVAAGAEMGFVFVYLPALLLFYTLPQISIPHLPLTAHWAAIWGILLGMPLRGDPIKLRWNLLDTIMVLLLFSVAVTETSNTSIIEGINAFRTDLTQWIAPYFLARIVFRDLNARRTALQVVIALLAVISVAALIECRLYPYWYLHVLQKFGFAVFIPPMAYHRYSFNRTSAVVDQPIYFGNLSLALLGLVALLAKSSGKKLTSFWVALALFAAFGCMITAISFTPIMGLGAGMVCLLVLLYWPLGRRLLLPLVLLVGAVAFGITYRFAHTPLGPRPESVLEGSYYIRHAIVVESWKRAQTAGPFGLGLHHDFSQSSDADSFSTGEDVDFDISSIDNTYMQFAMTRGWVYLLLWVSLGIVFSWRMTRTLSHMTHPSQLFPLAIGCSVILGLMVSMYTVWAGASYTAVWMILLGITNTLMDMVLYPERAAAPATAAAGGHRMWRATPSGAPAAAGFAPPRAWSPMDGPSLNRPSNVTPPQMPMTADPLPPNARRWFS